MSILNKKDKKCIFLISNMYPSNKSVSYGIFVKNIEKILIESGFKIFPKVVLNKKNNSFFKKTLSYFKFYLKIIYNWFFKSGKIVYVHYILHSGVIACILKHFYPKFVVMNAHGSDVKFKGFLKFLNYFVFKKSDVIIIPSYAFYKYMRKEFNFKNFLFENKIKVFPSGGIDCNLFKPIDIFLNVKYKRKFKIIGFVSRLTPQKGIYVFIKALKIVKERYRNNFKVILVGRADKKQLDDIDKYLESCGLKDIVLYLGEKSQDELLKIYNVMDVLVFPTLLEESLGLVGIEAMACGVPVIGSNVVGLKEYIKDGYNGFIFKKGDFLELANKLLFFLSLSDEKRRELSFNAEKTVVKYCKNKLKKDFVEIFNIK